MQKKTKIIIIVASASALVLVAVGAFLFYLRENERATSIDSSNYTRLADGVTDQGVTDANLGSFADRYSGDFVTARDDVSMTAETEWNQDTLSKVYFLFEYYKKTRIPDAVTDLLSRLEVAEAAGLSTENTELAAGSEYREDLVRWVNDTISESPESSYYGEGGADE